MSGSRGQIFEFDGFRMETAERRLTKDGEPVTLPNRAFDLLHALVENGGRLVTKEELYRRVWADQFVEDANLTVQISAIRKALGAGYIDTVKGHGYRFAADVRQMNIPGDAVLIESQTFSRLTVEHEFEDERRPRRRVAYLIVIGGLIAAAAMVGGYLLRRGPETSSAGRTVEFAKVTSNGKVTNLAASAGGKFVVFARTEDDGESLWVRQIETGSQTRVVPPRPLEYVGLAVTPDESFVYASVFEKNHADTVLQKIPLLGGAPEVIDGLTTGISVSFSPDGKFFAYTEPHPTETHLKIAAADGGERRLLTAARRGERAFTFFQANPVAWSPDGGTLAAAFDEARPSGTRSGILLVDPTDGAEKIFVEPRWAFIENIAWANGDELAFTAYDDEWTNQIWKVSRSTGEMRQVTTGVQNHRWLAPSPRGLFAVQINATASIRSAAFRMDADELASREILSESGHVLEFARTKDGSILYTSRASGRFEIWRLDGETGPIQMTNGADAVFGIAISEPDGSIIFGSAHEGRYSIMASDADGKTLRPLTEGPRDISPDVSPDGSIVFQRGMNNQRFGVWHLPAGSSEPVPIGQPGLKPIFSPDGRSVAYFLMDADRWRIAVRSLASDEAVRKFDLPTMVNDRRMRWHPSGKFLTMIYSAGEDLNMLLLPLDGGPPRIIGGLGKGEIGSFAWSADGEELLYSVTDSSRDVVLLGERSR